LDFGDLLPKKTQPIGISEAFFDARSLKDGRSGAARVRISIVEGYSIIQGAPAMAQDLCMQAQDLVLDYGDGRLLDEVGFQVHAQDRIAIIGRNGEGKSSLMKIMQGQIKPDSGSCRLQSGVRIAGLEQGIPSGLEGTVRDWVSAPVLDAEDWSRQHRPDQVMAELKLDPDAAMDALSGGTLRRALLAHALVQEPDVLFLDEPTNHLDIDSIQWLESYLKSYKKALVFVTHDRVFMQALASRIFELDRGQLITFKGGYKKFLDHKQHMLEAEATEQALFDKKLAQEERWIRQGIQARRTRNEGRVRALKKMREDRAARRDRAGNIKIEQGVSGASSKIIFSLKAVSVARGDATVIKDFSTTVLKGDKVGIIGPNGCGKSTLIQTLLGTIPVDQGAYFKTDACRVAYFDQHRAQLDLEATALDAVAEGCMTVEVNGQSKHVISYLQDFMFTPEKARSKVKVLSGGERNRLLLAKILLKPCDVLVMDEPTNDLDIESLELLEAFLVDFKGTLLLVSHDRALLNHAVTSTWVFTGNGHIENLVGGFDDAMGQLGKTSVAFAPASGAPVPEAAVTPPPKPAPQHDHATRKAIAKITRQISKQEEAIQAMHDRMGEPGYYDQDPDLIQRDAAKLAQQERELEALYATWSRLEDGWGLSS
jgi:ABC transport system ATP-binding/permease protein